MSIRPGINNSSLEIKNIFQDSKDTDFGNKMAARIGIEAEFILPFNKNKWGIIIEPTYQYFKSEQSRATSNISGGFLVSKVDYKSIELPLGVRYYIYFNNQSKLFANLSYVLDFTKNSTIKFLRNDGSMLSELEIRARMNFALGIGYKYKDRYSLEIRYYTKRNILGEYLYWNSDYRTISILFGYSLF